ncbi:uncharacterized protein F4822DRAFT_418486 [Hypoxylon trugodes]|uniref:uncharacterized protein n=1 Tax=Hypoxylon trugodes TaxID=326681 RepID=UPI00219B40E7|nr:uncharacterized protein F4822DRAFT_418486 [Hypoxylon trugodes]KAI1384053.1 hypothetical protein F4822DRAFT_418486 [Hypoxylon trugodes]
MQVSLFPVDFSNDIPSAIPSHPFNRFFILCIYHVASLSRLYHVPPYEAVVSSASNVPITQIVVDGIHRPYRAGGKVHHPPSTVPSPLPQFHYNSKSKSTTSERKHRKKFALSSLPILLTYCIFDMHFDSSYPPNPPIIGRLLPSHIIHVGQSRNIGAPSPSLPAASHLITTTHQLPPIFIFPFHSNTTTTPNQPSIHTFYQSGRKGTATKKP